MGGSSQVPDFGRPLNALDSRWGHFQAGGFGCESVPGLREISVDAFFQFILVDTERTGEYRVPGFLPTLTPACAKRVDAQKHRPPAWVRTPQHGCVHSR